ncbi:hypothetical protein PAECIP111802_00558 [Paenibacillus allorhizosphaerae]|uniref:Metallo-beta-lactamase domain-containing protein n=2 Tax=Paenibacillus allorhizosphaerae TaxID=2849866 RepID=A0ABM8VBG8_9BACL|nr:MBL fold metallo-hydrolase [Paenibacillus allorhizosphaerae]CAG7618844.1 hypothetical protein PAECIP111802_00558 [Paenibacillus allorhizosphaerae]
MMNQMKKHGIKMAGFLVVSALLATAACAQVNPEPQQTAAPLPKEEKADDAPQLRTKEVFDTAKYKGLLQIHYFHLKDTKVGTGDSYLITTPDGKNMLMDAGIASTGWQVVRYLDQLGIKELDAAYNTHPHTDHLGGYAEVLKAKDAKIYYRQSHEYTDSSQYRNTIAQVDKKKIPQKILKTGDTFMLGNEVKFEVLSPNVDNVNAVIKNNEASSINFYSLVVKMTYKDTSFIFPGDIYKDREAELVEKFGNKLHADFVHAPHHGNATSSSPTWVDAVVPKVTVLSSNIFNNLEVLKRYERKGSEVYSTGLNGNILITSDGKKLNVVTEKDRVDTKNIR